MPYVRDTNRHTRGAGAIASLDGVAGRKGGETAHGGRVSARLDRARAAAAMGALGMIREGDHGDPVTAGGHAPTGRPRPVLRPGTIVPTTSKYPGMRPHTPTVPTRPGLPPPLPRPPRPPTTTRPPMTPAGPIIPGGRVIIPSRPRTQVGPPPPKPPIPVTTATPPRAPVPTTSSTGGGGGGGGTWTPPPPPSDPGFDESFPEIPTETVPDAPPEKKPNYLLYAAIAAAGAFLLWRKGH